MKSDTKWWTTPLAQATLRQWVHAVAPDVTHASFTTHGPSCADIVRRTVWVHPQQLVRGVHPPALWSGRCVTNRDELEQRVARALARHEAGHIRFSQAVEPATPEEAWLWNALEDERIERLVGYMHPTMAADFAALGALIHRHAFIEPWKHAPPGVRLLTACLLARWDQHVAPDEAHTPALIHDQERPGSVARIWEEEIEPRVRCAWDAPTSARTLELAREIIIGITSAFGPLDIPELPVIMTGDVIGVSGNERGPSILASSAVRTTPKNRSPEDSSRRSTSPKRDVLRALARIRPHAMRVSDHLRHAGTWRTDLHDGNQRRISPRALVRSRERYPWAVRAHDGAALSVAVLIDCTGSMNVKGEDGTSAIQAAKHAALMLDLAARRAGVRLAVGANGGAVPPLEPLRWIRRCAERTHDALVWQRIMDVEAAGGKECYSAGLRGAAEELASQGALYRLIVLIMDGEPTDETPEAVAATVQDVQHQGVRVLGIFLGAPGEQQRRALRVIFGNDHVLIARNVADVPDLLARAIVNWF